MHYAKGREVGSPSTAGNAEFTRFSYIGGRTGEKEAAAFVALSELVNRIAAFAIPPLTGEPAANWICGGLWVMQAALGRQAGQTANTPPITANMSTW